MIDDGHEAYIEAEMGYSRKVGGTLAEVKEFWESSKHAPNGVKTRLVLADGTALDERGMGSEDLRRRVAKRLEKGTWNNADGEMIAEMAALLGMDVDAQE